MGFGRGVTVEFKDTDALIATPHTEQLRRRTGGTRTTRADSGPGSQTSRSLWPTWELVAEGIAMPFLSWAFLWVFHNPYCGVIFQCGCTWNWAGGWTGCNVHNATGPKCPWCNASADTIWTVADNTVIALMCFAWLTAATVGHIKAAHEPDPIKQAAIRRRWRVFRWIAPPLMFIVHGVVAGAIFAFATGYPYYFWFKVN